MRCLDLFSGAGGLSTGLEAAGFETVAAVECDPDSCATYSRAFPGVDLKDTVIEALSFTAFRGIDLIAGGPPCQPFSSGGKRLADQDDRDCIPDFVRAVAEARPRAFLMENVQGLAAGSRRSYFTPLLRSLEHLGYTVTWKVLNAADYGVPQKRRRLFVVGLREGTFAFPEATHGPGRIPYVPVRECLRATRILGDPNPSKVVYARRPDLRPSPYDGHLFNGGGRPINLDQPSHTILASAGGNKTHFLDTRDLVPPYHAHLLDGGTPRSGTLEGARRITVEESALLQTFSRRMRFCGSRSSQYSQVGNAVPPALASILSKVLLQVLDEATPRKESAPVLAAAAHSG